MGKLGVLADLSHNLIACYLDDLTLPQLLIILVGFTSIDDASACILVRFVGLLHLR